MHRLSMDHVLHAEYAGCQPTSREHRNLMEFVRNKGHPAHALPSHVVDEENHGSKGTNPNTIALVRAARLNSSTTGNFFALHEGCGGLEDSSSLEPAEMAPLCHGSRTACAALGTAKPWCSQGLKKGLKAGDGITADAVRSVRPGFGFAPKWLDRIIGRRVTLAVSANTTVTPNLLTTAA